MNIVFFSRYFYPHIGGVEKHLLKLSEKLKKKHTITVITEQYEEDLPLVDYYDGITIYRVPQMRDNKQKKYKIWNYLYENRSIFLNGDVIHIHDVFYWYFPFRFMYPSKRVFTTFHGYEGNDLPTKKAILSHKIAEKLSRGNICIGDYLKKWYKTKPDIVSYGAVDLPRMNRSYEKKKKLTVLYIGRLEKEAGIIEYLRGVRELGKRGHLLHLTVLGDGSLRQEAEKYVQKYKLSVKFLGFVEKVEEYIPKSDIVFTSRFLGTLESLSFKRIVFCMYNNKIKRDCFEMAPFGRYLYLCSTVDDLVSQFETMLVLPKETKDKIDQGFSWVKSENWEKMASQYERLWNK